MGRNKNARRCEETALGDAQTPEEVSDVVRTYESLSYAGLTIVRMMLKKGAQISALAKAHRGVVDARRAMLPLLPVGKETNKNEGGGNYETH